MDLPDFEPVDLGRKPAGEEPPPPVDLSDAPAPIDAAPTSEAPAPVDMPDQAPVDAPYEDEKHAWEDIKNLGMEDLVKAAKKTWKGVTGTLSLGLQGLDTPRRATTGNIIKSLDPEAARSVEKALVKEGQDPNSVQTFNEIDKALNKVAPDLYLSSYITPKIKKLLSGGTFKAFGTEWRTQFLNETDAALAAGGVGLIADVLSDPLTYLTFGANNVAEAGSKAEQAKKLWNAVKSGEKTVGETLLEEAAKDLPKIKDFAEQVFDGEKILAALKLPFSEKKISILPKEVENKIATMLQESAHSGAIMKAKRAFPTMQLRTGLQEVDAARTQHVIGETAHKLRRKELETMLPEATDEVNNVVNALSEFGEEKGLKFLKDSGVKYTENDIAAGKSLYRSLDEEVIRAREYAKQNGVNIADFESAKPDERVQLTEAIKHQFGGTIPPEIEPYLFREKYGLPRQMKSESRMAEQTFKNQENAWTQTITDGGRLKLAPSSAKESEKYSTPVMNLLKQKSTGMVESFERNPVSRTLDRVEDIYRSVADKRYFDTVKKYGGTKEEMTKKIMEARSFVKHAGEVGIPVPTEIQQIASLNPSELKPVGEYPWQKIQSFTKTDEEASSAKKALKEYVARGEVPPDNILAKALKPTETKLTRQDLVFPPEVAVAIENRFGPKGYVADGVISGATQWLNSQWKKSVLTNPLRLFREGVENSAAYAQLGGNPKYLAEATADAIKWSSDPKKNKASAFATGFFESPYAETISSFDDNIWKKPMSYKEAVDINTNNVPFAQIMHDAAKTGREAAFDEILGITNNKSFKESFKDKAKKVAGIVDMVYDNKAAKAVRHFSGGTSSNITKLAYAKTLHFDKGIPYGEALRMADEALISFVDLPMKIKKAGVISPFIAFNARNIQRLPVLFASSPAGFTFYNKMKQAWANVGGWKPEDQPTFRQILGNHFQPDPIVGPMLKGTRAMENDPKYFATFGNMLGTAVFGDAFKEGMNDKIMTINFPDPFRAATTFVDPEQATENLGPVMKAGIAMLGVDPFTGQPLAYNGTELSSGERAQAMLKELNPFNFGQINQAANLAMQAMAPKYVENLTNLGFDEKLADWSYRKIYGDSYKAQKKGLEKAYNTIFNWSTLGFGRVTNAQFQGSMKTMALAKQIRTLMQDLHKKANKGQLSESEREKVVKAVKDTASQIRFNADMLDSYNNALMDGREGLSVERQMNDDGYKSEPGHYIDPLNNTESIKREPQSVGPQSMLEKIGNVLIPGAQAMGSGAPRENEIVSRGSRLTQKYLKPIKEASKVEEEPVDAVSVGEEDYLTPGNRVELYRELTSEDPATDSELEDADTQVKDSLEEIKEHLQNPRLAYDVALEETDQETARDILEIYEKAKREKWDAEQTLKHLVKEGFYAMGSTSEEK